MKNLLYILAFLSINAFGQTKYLTKTGTVSFEASVPSFEEVKATNKSVTAIINTDNGEFAALVLVKGFRFKNALMEEHFNENYAESDTYPKATFKGTIKDFDVTTLNKESKLSVNGTLTFHGESKELNDVSVVLSKEQDNISMSGAFKALASDFNIKIPKIIRNKIAEDIEVHFNFNLLKK
ncbi:YceI family protein [Seonamhaeicola sp.]|uniref:YceI family protein n=1 Tax=Seonamhaeicola sp. TaxID=1912245 RepID=UPI00261F2B73|nr:YceI family protein [Seonamhaeicola sp.]